MSQSDAQAVVDAEPAAGPDAALDPAGLPPGVLTCPSPPCSAQVALHPPVTPARAAVMGIWKHSANAQNPPSMVCAACGVCARDRRQSQSKVTVSQVLAKLQTSYKSTPAKLKLIDAYLLYILLTGAADATAH